MRYRKCFGGGNVAPTPPPPEPPPPSPVAVAEKLKPAKPEPKATKIGKSNLVIERNKLSAPIGTTGLRL